MCELGFGFLLSNRRLHDFFFLLFVMMMQSFETFEFVAYLSILRVGVS